MIILKINNTDYTEHCEGLEDFNINIARNTEDLVTEVGVSLNLKATGTLYNLLYETFYSDICIGIENKLDAIIEIDKGSCQFELDFVIVPEAVDICFDGCIDFVLKYEQPEEEKYKCLRNQKSFWSEDGWKDFIKSRSRKVLYCQDYTAMTYTIYIIYFFTIRTLVDIIDAICGALDNIGIEPDLCDTIDEFKNVVVGCNKYYTTVGLNDMFSFNTEKCGLKYQSTILAGPIYKNTFLETAVGGEGERIENCTDSDRQFNENNAPYRNILQIMVGLREIFNADFRIKNDTLIFERKDYFFENNPFLVNIDDSADSCPLYKIDPEYLKAYWDFQFSLDSMDFQGNKSINEYNEIVEWNTGGQLNRKGKKTINTSYTPSKWSNDEGLFDSFEQAVMIVLRTLQGSCNFRHAQIVQDGQLGQYKLLVLDDKDKIGCEKCSFWTPIKRKVGRKTIINILNAAVDVFDYNYPMKGQSLYDNFHYIDDVKSGEARFIVVDEVKYYPTDFCKDVELILQNGLLVGVQSRYGETIPERIDIDFTDCSITLNNLRFKCNFAE